MKFIKEGTIEGKPERRSGFCLCEFYGVILNIGRKNIKRRLSEESGLSSQGVWCGG